MNAQIVLLPEDVINQIAAGEVIENPASVVKELLDNAIDAGARHIEVEIHAGGQQFIKVEDDGCGMSSIDVKMCLLRHATSKLKCLDDLDMLQTMGFRGEALAAIAAISKLEIRTSDGSDSTRLLAEAGKIMAIEPCARNKGTTVEVRSLFFNTPGRRKFQKSASSNAAAIVRMVQSLALSHPEISFVLRSQGGCLLDVREGNWKERIEQVLGADVCKNGIWLETDRLIGCLGAPADAKSTRLGQYFFLNRRPIFSPLLARAVREGYGTRILEGSHPALVLMLERDPGDFDVNVHPQKKEVRFRNEGELFQIVREAVQSAFLPQMPSFSSDVSFQPLASDPWEMPVCMREPMAAERISMQGTLMAEESAGQALTIVGPFLLAERESEIWVVDLRDAYEQRAHSSSGSQSLLVPIHLTLTREEAEQMPELMKRCSEVGLEIKSLGSRQLCVEAVPEWLDPADAPFLMKALQEDLFSDLSREDTLRRFCRTSPKRWTLREAEWLWKKHSPREARLEAGDLERILARKT